MEITDFIKPILKIDVPTVAVIPCRTCTIAQYKKLRRLENAADVLKAVSLADKLPDILLNTAVYIWAEKYIEAIEDYCSNNVDWLAVPSDGTEDAKRAKLEVFTAADKLVADYARLSFRELQSVDVIDYRLLLADAVKHNIYKNKEDAVDYLNGCYCNMHDMFTADMSSIIKG